jgi:hypothetical protein
MLHNWKLVLRKAWSIRLMILVGVEVTIRSFYNLYSEVEKCQYS